METQPPEKPPRKGLRLEAGLVISAAALIASLVTTVLSIQRADLQDVNAKKDALHAVIQQYEDNVIHKLEVNKAQNAQLFDLGFNFDVPEEKQDFDKLPAQAAKKIGQILDYLKDFNAHVAFETRTLAKQALSKVGELDDAASSVDLADSAVVALDAGLSDVPEQLYRKAVAKARNALDYGSAERGLAQALYQDGRRKEAQAALDDAVEAPTKFPSATQNADDVHRWRFQTYLGALDYLSADDCDTAKAYATSARGEARQIAAEASELEAKLKQARQGLPACFPPK